MQVLNKLGINNDASEETQLFEEDPALIELPAYGSSFILQ